MADSLANALIRRLTALADAQARVDYVRSLLRTLPADDLRIVERSLIERAGLRETGAQIALLALVEAQESLAAEARRRASGPPPPDGRRTVGVDWGTGRPLTLGERKSLARRPERRLIERAVRDAHPDVIAELLVNPRLTEADVARMCAAKTTPTEVIARVFASARWAVRPRVRVAIAQNPRTPPELAVALVPLLSRAELRELAADARIGNAVRARALEVLRRLPPTPHAPPERLH